LRRALPRIFSKSVAASPAAPWPTHLWLVRHGESAGNVARDAAERAGLPMIQIAERDVDVPLSELGERQSRALGRWFGALPEAERPNVVFNSPYVRAMQTADRIIEAAAMPSEQLLRVVDERLREKEFGSLNRLTRAGILAQFPQEAALRTHIGKFYYRPPGGESWCDVILRLRSVLDQIQLQHRGERVLIVAHQVIVLAFRYLLERMTEAQILAIDKEKDVANCGVTAYQLGLDTEQRRGMQLRLYNFVTPLEEAGEPVTKSPDAPVAPR
jgi:2,3-bisphosphoglycerate-dependent phosphoglycerate mutase